MLSKKVEIKHFDKKGEGTFTEIWKLKTPLTGIYETDKKRLKKMVTKNAHVPNEKYATKIYVVSWGTKDNKYSFVLENNK